MKTYTSDTRIFFNKDCGKYGVDKLVKGYVLDGKQLYKWSQQAISDKQIYTPYRAVALRWARSIATDAIEVRADMQDQSIIDDKIHSIEYVSGLTR